MIIYQFIYSADDNIISLLYLTVTSTNLNFVMETPYKFHPDERNFNRDPWLTDDDYHALANVGIAEGNLECSGNQSTLQDARVVTLVKF